MATVYQAVQEGPHGFENEVAIKLVHGDLIAAYPHILKMLVDEARIAARIKHPNVARILDLVEERERFYMVMDFVDGLSMRQVLDAARDTGGSIPLAPILEVLGLACRGLHAAHKQTLPDGTSLGLVHRDVKPGNILVSIEGEVKVSDFGIALFGDRLAESTAHGQLKGTPAYMSPEQVMGEKLDPRSDIFSMGLTLYTLVTTKLAFTADSPMKIAVKIAKEPLDSHADELEELLPGLGDVLAKATNHDPDERYQTAAELGAALTALHRTFEHTTTIAEMLAAGGWRPASERGEPVAGAAILTSPGVEYPVPDEEEEEETDPGLETDGDEPLDEPPAGDEPPGGDEPTVGDELPVGDEPTAGAQLLGGDEPTAGDELLPNDSEPTADHPGPVSAPGVGDPADPFDPEATPPAPDESATVVELFPAAPPVEVLLPGDSGFQPAPPAAPPRPAAPGTAAPTRPHVRPGPIPAPPRPGSAPRHRTPGAPPPGGPQPHPEHHRAQQTIPPGAGASASHRRVQPLRDYRGRVVRKPPPPPETTRVSGLEKLGVAAAFLMLAATVGTIVLVQLKADPPGDPRFVDGETVISDEQVEAAPPPVAVTPAAVTPEPSPVDAPAGLVIEDETSGKAAAAAATPVAPPVATPTPRPSPTQRTGSKGTARAADSPTPAEAATPAAVVKGSITVNTYPWSQVYIDGKERGRTPIVGLALRAGEHTVRLVFPTRDNEEMTESVTVEPGKEAKVVHRLTDGSSQ